MMDKFFNLSNYSCVSEMHKREFQQMLTATKSQRQRAVLFRIWELQKEGHKTFESYYAFKMEAHISDLKGVLESLTT